MNLFTFVRTAQGRLPGLMSSKGKTTFSSKKEAQTASFFSDSKLRVILLNKKAGRVFVILRFSLCAILLFSNS